MQVLDRTGVGTLWSICKTKFALAGHTHNYAGSGSAGGSANSAISVVDYGQTSKKIQIGYSGSGITGEQIKYIAGYTAGSGDVNAKIKNVSKDALKSWLGLGSLAYSSSNIPTKLSQLTNDKGFVAGSVSGNTVTINGVSTTWTNTWRGIQDNLTSTSTSESLSANQGRVLKGLVDGKANSSHTHSWSQISGAPATATRWPSWGEVTSKPDLKSWSETKSYIDSKKPVAVVGNGSTVKLRTPPKMFTETIQETFYDANSQIGALGNTIEPEIRYNCTYMIMSKYNSDVMWHKFTGMFDYVLITGNMSGTVQEEILKKFGLKQDWYQIVDTYDNTYFFIKMKDVFIYEYKGFIQHPLNQDAEYRFNVYYTTYYRYTDKGIQECDSMGNLLT